MARWMTPTPEQESGLAQWISERPPQVRVIMERLNFYELFKMKSTGQRVIVHSVSEDGTVTVSVSAQFNAVLMERSVFGVDPDDLEPCELPAENEIVGAVLSQEGADENIDVLRVMVRPDLWEMGVDGTAVRRDKS